MLTKEDKNWLVTSFVTRGEHNADVKELKEGLSRVESLSKKTLAIVEGLAGKVADLDQENKMGALTLRRHDIQIHELATATGTAISE
jgi:hypothetical protein